MAVLNFPNILTLMRILLLPCFAAALIYGSYRLSLLIFIISALTDLFDGFLARTRNETTKIGGILDPLADKFLLVTSFIIMSIKGWIPVWLTITVLSRDIIIVAGWLILSFISGFSSAAPSMMGKVAVFSQFILIGVVLFLINVSTAFSVPDIVMLPVALLTAISGDSISLQGLGSCQWQLEGELK